MSSINVITTAGRINKALGVGGVEDDPSVTSVLSLPHDASVAQALWRTLSECCEDTPLETVIRAVHHEAKLVVNAAYRDGDDSRGGLTDSELYFALHRLVRKVEMLQWLYDRAVTEDLSAARMADFERRAAVDRGMR